jgi:hypothetical protein
MRGVRMKILHASGIALIALLAWPQITAAQRSKPVPHAIGHPQQAPAQAPAKAEFSARSNTAGKGSPAPFWTPLTNQPNFLADGASVPMLMTDGTVLVQDAGFPDWWKLTPDENGSYINGTWTQVASLQPGYSPLYHSSAVLPDGRLIVEGGEYNFDISFTNEVWTNLGAIFDPIANTWTPMTPPPFFGGIPPRGIAQTIGDASSVILPNGTYMQANCCTVEQALLDAKTLTWTSTGAGKFDTNNEEGWTLLPNGKVLTVDAFVPVNIPYEPTGMNSEIYNPRTGTWSSAGSTVVQLWDSWLTCGELSQPFPNQPTFELGPGVLRPDGTVFYMGADTCPDPTTASGFASGHTAIYNSFTGKWKAGPDIPGGNNIADGPAALEPNGKVLMFASPSFGAPPSAFFEWDGKNITPAPATPNTPIDGSFFGNMLVLPTGQILFTDFSNDIEIYTPTPGHPENTEPIVIFTPIFLKGGQSYKIYGFRFNGISQGSAYGDDVQGATNYPLVRITNLITGHVQYSRTHDHSSMAVASDEFVSTHFDVPGNQERGISKLEVVANGVASDPVFVFVE